MNMWMYVIRIVTNKAMSTVVGLEPNSQSGLTETDTLNPWIAFEHNTEYCIRRCILFDNRTFSLV